MTAPRKFNLQALEKLGFETVTDEIKGRMFASIEGLYDTGKTTLAMTAPGPIAIINQDDGLEGITKPFLDAGKEMVHIKMGLPIEVLDGLPKKIFSAADKSGVDAKTRDKVADAANEVWESCKRAFIGCIPYVRSIIWDTADEGYELQRIARFGRLEQVPAHFYGPIKMEFAELLRSAFNAGVNVICISKMKKVWEGKGYERAGLDRMENLAQVMVRNYRNSKGEYGFKVIKCRQSPLLVGMDFRQPINTIPMLASQVYEGHEKWADPEEWM